ncbi:MAG: lipopolysaccharide biosynthesis protein, partial [Armatimonadota bacterium]
MDASTSSDPSIDTQQGISASDSRRHFLRNTITNMVFVVFNVGTSLYMVPYLIAHLGVANYGMVTLANSFVAYTEVLTAAVFGTVFRFAGVHIARRENKQAEEYANTQLVFVAWLTAVLVPVAGLISYLTPRFLNIPPGQTANTQLLFFAVYVAFALTMVSSAFGLGTLASQRFDISNIIEMLNQIVRYSTWIVLF